MPFFVVVVDWSILVISYYAHNPCVPVPSSQTQMSIVFMRVYAKERIESQKKTANHIVYDVYEYDAFTCELVSFNTCIHIYISFSVFVVVAVNTATY